MGLAEGGTGTVAGSVETELPAVTAGVLTDAVTARGAAPTEAFAVIDGEEIEAFSTVGALVADLLGALGAVLGVPTETLVCMGPTFAETPAPPGDEIVIGDGEDAMGVEVEGLTDMPIPAADAVPANANRAAIAAIATVAARSTHRPHFTTSTLAQKNLCVHRARTLILL